MSGGTRESDARSRVVRWVLLTGHREVVAGVAVAGVFVLMAGLIGLRLITVGPGSSLPSLLSSGVTSGLFTLITVTLSINQLLLSRVMGSPDMLRERFEGSINLRDDVEGIADTTATPNDPAAFLSFVAETMTQQVTDLDRIVDDSELDDSELDDDLSAYRDDIIRFSSDISKSQGRQTNPIDALGDIIGDDFARSITRTRQLRDEYAGKLPADARDKLDSITELLRSLGVTRQYLKTLTIQQQLSRLSRLVGYTGFLALIVTFSLALVYESNGTTTVSPRYLWLVASVGIAIIVSPLAILISYILRVATISRYTVSVGPFTPPLQEFDESLMATDAARDAEFHATERPDQRSDTERERT